MSEMQKTEVQNHLEKEMPKAVKKVVAEAIIAKKYAVLFNRSPHHTHTQEMPFLTAFYSCKISEYCQKSTRVLTSK
jgi:hypothetical protein